MKRLCRKHGILLAEKDASVHQLQQFWKIQYGRVPERSKGADCKSVAFSFDGSNPSSPTKQERYRRKAGAFFVSLKRKSWRIRNDLQTRWGKRAASLGEGSGGAFDSRRRESVLSHQTNQPQRVGFLFGGRGQYKQNHLVRRSSPKLAIEFRDCEVGSSADFSFPFGTVEKSRSAPYPSSVSRGRLTLQQK